ncbi:MAG: hypothetical protein R3B90_07230 [Planctomycetaceae bacterium]
MQPYHYCTKKRDQLENSKLEEPGERCGWRRVFRVDQTGAAACDGFGLSSSKGEGGLANRRRLSDALRS